MAVGTPTEASIQAMVTNAVDILEKHRVYGDATALPSGELETLLGSLTGQYANDVAGALSTFRALMSANLDQSVALSFLEPLIFEYAKFISESGSVTEAGSADINVMFKALYDHMVINSLTVESRAISHDVSTTKTTTLGGTIVGTGDITRLFVDAQAFELEACTVEQKKFRCTRDQNTGVKETAEVFSVQGEAPPPDQFGRNGADVVGQLGRGDLGTIQALHAGSGQGGSKLKNSSFSTYDVAATNDFNGWAFTGTTVPVQSVVAAEVYRSFPNASTDASMKFVEDAKMVQTLSDMTVSSIDSRTPYYCRIMVEADEGSASGGTVTLRCGSVSAAATIAAIQSAGNWFEIRIGDEALAGSEAAKDQWPENFMEDGFDIEIEWSGFSSGYLNVDDAIFAPYTLIDGTWWAITQSAASSPLAFLQDDLLHVTDTGGAPGTAENQYWFYRSGLGYLPHTTATPTWADPA